LQDKYGNLVDPEVGYARGKILRSSVEEMQRRQWGLELIRRRTEANKQVYCFTGVTDRFSIKTEDLDKLVMDMGHTYYFHEEELKRLAVEFVGGSSDDSASSC
jgi:L-seryl-tRNA(Ser) seleniumtransferase